MAAFQKSPSGLWTPQRTTHVARNLLNAYGTARPEHLALGRQFYPTWHGDAQLLGERTGAGLHSAAAMIARLSPTTEAEANRMMGFQLLSVDDKAASHIRQSAAYANEAATLKKGNPEKDKLRLAAAQARSKAGLKGTPLNLQSSINIAQSLDHRDGLIQNPLTTLGNVKINDFAGAIVNPYAERQTIDTHYHDAALGRTDIPYDESRGLTSKGRYENFQHAAGLAYRKAGERGMLDPSEVPANGFMGGIWYRQQQTKADNNPDSSRVRKASDTRNRNFLSAADSARWNPAAFGRPASLSQQINY